MSRRESCSRARLAPRVNSSSPQDQRRWCRRQVPEKRCLVLGGTAEVDAGNFRWKNCKARVGESRQCTGLENRPPSLCSLPKAWRARRTRATSTGITQVALHQAVFVHYDGAVYLVDTPQLEKQGSWKARIQHNPAFLMRCS